MDANDLNFALNHWRAYVERCLGAVEEDEHAQIVHDEGVALIRAEPELWAERGWQKLWNYIAELPAEEQRVAYCALCGRAQGHADDCERAWA